MARSPEASSQANYDAAYFWLFLLVLSFTSSLFAQNRNAGEIRGTVTDSSGAPSNRC